MYRDGITPLTVDEISGPLMGFHYETGHRAHECLHVSTDWALSIKNTSHLCGIIFYHLPAIRDKPGANLKAS